MNESTGEELDVETQVRVELDEEPGPEEEQDPERWDGMS